MILFTAEETDLVHKFSSVTHRATLIIKTKRVIIRTELYVSCFHNL